MYEKKNQKHPGRNIAFNKISSELVDVVKGSGDN